jgi:hypothetical protein
MQKKIRKLSIVKKDDRGPLDLTRQVDELKKENIRLKNKLKEATAHNKMMYKFP